MRIGKSWWLIYVTLAAGFGGWRADDLWSGAGIWVLGALPIVACATAAVSQTGNSLRLTAMMVGLMLLASLPMAAYGLLFAWLTAKTTADWTSPALRAAVGALASFGLGLVIARAYRRGGVRQNPAQPPAHDTSDPSPLT